MTLRHALPLFGATLAIVPMLACAAFAEAEPSLSAPIRHENIAVYFLRGTSAPGPVPDSLQEALSKGTVEVRETGNVRELKIENRGDTPVFVQFGDIVKGGQQDRVLTISMILEPRSGAIPIGAYCVEQGRWAARGGEDVRRFALSEAIMPSREAKIAMARPLAAKPLPPAAPRALGASGVAPPEQRQQELRELNRDIDRMTRQRTVQQLLRELPGGDGQSEVWRSVGLVQQQLSDNLKAPVASERSRTSLQLALEHEKLKTAQAAYLAVLEPAGLAYDDTIGVVIAVDGRISGADVYPSSALFRKMWPKLARAAATEALAARKAAGAAPEPPSVEDVARFLKSVETGEKGDREIAGIARVETRNTDKALRIETRSAKGDVVHRNYLAY
jgi:hypothetical protein